MRPAIPLHIASCIQASNCESFMSRWGWIMTHTTSRMDQSYYSYNTNSEGKNIILAATAVHKVDTGDRSTSNLQKLAFWMLLLPYFFQPRCPSSGIPLLMSTPGRRRWYVTTKAFWSSDVSMLTSTSLQVEPGTKWEVVDEETTLINSSKSSY
jgi:hypothetical protein